MTKLEEIYIGWKNYIFQHPEIEKQAKRRISICVKCDKLKSNNVCFLCGCYMPAKVRSIKSSCLLKKW